MPKPMTASQVIDALGGNRKVAELTGRGYTAICNWRARGEFPPTLYLRMSRALQDAGYAAPPELWGMEMEVRVREVA